MRSCNKPNKPNEAPNCDCAHQGLGGDWRENRGSSGGLEGGGIAQVVSMRGVFWGVRTHPQVPGSILVCQDLPGGTGVLRMLTPTLGSTRTHFGVSGPTRGGGGGGRVEGSHCPSGSTRTHFGVSLPILGVLRLILRFQNPFWVARTNFRGPIAHTGVRGYHSGVPLSILECQNPSWGANVFLGYQDTFWHGVVHPGASGSVLGYQDSYWVAIGCSEVPGHILGCHCPSWDIRICTRAPRPILECCCQS